jgi:hypothetical protein
MLCFAKYLTRSHLSTNVNDMQRSQPLQDDGSGPHALHDRAIEDLRFIRQTLERAGGFTTLSGWGQVAIGTTALVAALLAEAQTDPVRWLLIWIIEAMVALAIGGWTVGRKARSSGFPLLAAGRKVALGLAPPLVAGALLTLFLFHHGLFAPIPGVWLLLFGVGTAAVGTYSVRIVPAMGFCFMILGGIALFAPVQWGNLLLALGFGGVHIFFGIRIAWRHGG